MASKKVGSEDVRPPKRAGGQEGVRGEENLPPGSRWFGRKEGKTKGRKKGRKEGRKKGTFEDFKI